MAWSIESIPSLEDKTAVVTGANSGLGFYTSLHLARQGAEVFMACRDSGKAQKAADEISRQVPKAKLQLCALDLADLASVERCADHIKHHSKGIDFLVNNAGVMIPQTFSTTQDGFELQFGVNYLGHFAFTGHLFEHINEQTDSRIVNLGSIAHLVGNIDFDNLNSERNYSRVGAYGRSKLACIMFGYELQRRLKGIDSKIKSTVAHPGWSSTELQRHSTLFDRLNPVFAQSSEDGAMPTLRALTDEQAKGGHYFGPSGLLQLKGKPKRVKSKPISYNKDVASKLWQTSETLTGVSWL